MSSALLAALRMVPFPTGEGGGGQILRRWPTTGSSVYVWEKRCTSVWLAAHVSFSPGETCFISPTARERERGIFFFFCGCWIFGLFTVPRESGRRAKGSTSTTRPDAGRLLPRADLQLS